MIHSLTGQDGASGAGPEKFQLGQVVATPGAIGGVLSETESARIRFFTPDQLFAFIEEQDAKDASRSETIRGYKVKVKHTVIDNASKADRKQMLAKIIGDSKKRKKD